MTVSIGRGGRDALYNVLLTELSGVGDISVQLASGRSHDAVRLRRRYEQSMRLLDDLGWEREPEKEHFDLTMPTIELRSILERLYWSSATVLTFACETDPLEVDRVREAQRTCSDLLATLA